MFFLMFEKNLKFEKNVENMLRHKKHFEHVKKKLGTFLGLKKNSEAFGMAPVLYGWLSYFRLSPYFRDRPHTYFRVGTLTLGIATIHTAAATAECSHPCT